MSGSAGSFENNLFKSNICSDEACGREPRLRKFALGKVWFGLRSVVRPADRAMVKSGRSLSEGSTSTSSDTDSNLGANGRTGTRKQSDRRIEAR